MAAGQAYKTAIMMSEVPGIDWIAKGWRGVATYLIAAASRVEAGDRGAKAQKVDRATRLLVFLAQVTPEDPPLGATLRGIYDNLMVRIVQANLQDDAAQLRAVAAELWDLDEQMTAVNAGAAP